MSFTSRLLLSSVGLVALTALVLAGVADWVVRDSLTPAEVERQLALARARAQDLEDRVLGLRGDVTMLAHLPVAAGLAAPDSDAEPFEMVRPAFQAMMQAKPSVLQARVIALPSGEERLRFERDAAGGEVRQATALQSKAARPYVQAGMDLAAGEVHLSPLNLNREHGAVQQPPRPVLRAVTPVFAGATRVGLVVINVDMGPALAALSATPLGTTYLVDEQGRFLVHPDPAVAFAHEYGPGVTIGQRWPAVTRLTAADAPGAAVLGGPNDSDVVVAAVPVQLAGGPRVTVVTVQPASSIAGVNRSRALSAWGAAGVGLLAALMALFWGQRLARPLRAMTAAADRFPTDDDVPLPVDEPGEMGVLAQALARMNDKIQSQNRALSEQERRFRAVVEESPIAKFLVDDKHHILLVNRRAEELFGYSRKELLGSSIHRLVPEGQRDVHPGFIDGYHQDPGPRPMGPGRELFGQRKDGALVPVEIGLNPLPEQGGTVTLATVVDVSERKGREDELRRSNRELEQFAYVASHDLQEPLRMVANYTELLAERYQDKLDDKAQTFIHFASDGARRMQRLISDLLTYSRVGTEGKAPERFDPATALRWVQQDLRAPIAATGADISHDALPLVYADGTQLGQVLQNLVGNALKFCGDDAPRIHIGAAREGRWVRFSVQDNGIGMNPEHTGRIFDMFQRLHPVGTYDGSGIGLSVTKRIIERHGGRIWVESEIGGGTTFFFTLPAAEDA